MLTRIQEIGLLMNDFDAKFFSFSKYDCNLFLLLQRKRNQLGLYKVEFRILDIRISGETNLKKHFLSGNWIRKKIFKGLPNRKEWCVLHNFKQPNFGRKKRLNFGFRPKNHSEFWRRPFFFFFFFWRDHLILAGKNCIVTVCHELF